METFESSCSVTHGSTVLVAMGAPMWDLVKINGGLAIQKIGRIRADGILAQPRGNETNTITFSLCNEAAGPAAAAEAALRFPIALPKTMADVTIAFASGSIVLKNAAVVSWQTGEEEMLGRHSVTIVGGELMETET